MREERNSERHRLALATLMRERMIPQMVQETLEGKPPIYGHCKICHGPHWHFLGSSNGKPG